MFVIDDTKPRQKAKSERNGTGEEIGGVNPFRSPGRDPGQDPDAVHQIVELLSKSGRAVVDLSRLKIRMGRELKGVGAVRSGA
jgi:hypothetical protein